MKRILAGLALAALVVAGLSAAAEAAPVWATKILPIRNSQAAYQATRWDTLYFSRNSAGTEAAALSDTTAAFTLENRAHTSSAINVGTDSLLLMRVKIMPTTAAGTTAAADSFTVQMLGSMNGEDYVAGPAIDILEIATSNCFERTFNSTYCASAPATATNVTMGYYKMFKIVVKDFTGTTGQFQVAVDWLYDEAGAGTAGPTH